VDEYALQLRQAIKALLGNEVSFSKVSAWEDHSFAIAVTHDVDFLHKYHSGMALRLSASLGLHYKQWKAAAQTFIEFSKVRSGLQSDPYEFQVIERLHRIESEYQCKAAYYFLVRGDSPAEVGAVDLQTPAARHVIDFLENEGHEIGLHPSTSASMDEQKFAQQLHELQTVCREPILGGRQHYLYFTVPATWRLWENYGLCYDTTLGYPEQPGFRCGTCFPFRPFDLLARCVMDLWELPLIMMDKTLYDRHYMGLRPEQAWLSIKGLLDKTRAVGGVFTLLWHPTLVDEISFPGWTAIFRRVLEYGVRNQAFIGPPCDVLAMWERQTRALEEQ